MRRPPAVNWARRFLSFPRGPELGATRFHSHSSKGRLARCMVRFCPWERCNLVSKVADDVGALMPSYAIARTGQLGTKSFPSVLNPDESVKRR